MAKPLLLDLFCGAGGATKGYQRAGFSVIGVDEAPQPRYCGDEFIQADALSYFEDHWMFFDVFHASPPCQRYSNLQYAPGRNMAGYADLIAVTREAFEYASNYQFVPWVIENVPQAPLKTGLMLCGSMFELKVFKHRSFESNIYLWNIPHKPHIERITALGTRMAYYSKEGQCTVAGHLFSKKAGSQAMQIDWMTKRELAEAIPPAYTEYIGHQLLTYLENVRKAREPNDHDSQNMR